ncbi:MAG: hypothetical protein AAGI46_02015 [Planctomycetota bacterium]
MPTTSREKPWTTPATNDRPSRPIKFPPAKMGYDEDDYGERGATLLFTGLFGTIPGSTADPVKLPQR